MANEELAKLSDSDLQTKFSEALDEMCTVHVRSVGEANPGAMIQAAADKLAVIGAGVFKRDADFAANCIELISVKIKEFSDRHESLPTNIMSWHETLSLKAKRVIAQSKNTYVGC